MTEENKQPALPAEPESHPAQPRPAEQAAQPWQPQQTQPVNPNPPAGAQPYPHIPYSQPTAQPPCNQPSCDQVGGPQPPYGQPPMPQPYPYGYAQQPQPRKKWPWVLGGCLLALLLSLGGCVGCAASLYLAMEADPDYNGSFDPYYNDDRRDYDRRHDPDADDAYDLYDGFTLEDIGAALGIERRTPVDGVCGPGLYVVGEDIEPGLYFLEGHTMETNYYILDRNEGTDTYELETAVEYFGNYFCELEAGEAIAFAATDGLRMYPAADAAFAPEAPYRNGCYRVGVDIPAGTYNVTIDEITAGTTDSDPAAYVMKDTEFDDDSILETRLVAPGGRQTITVRNGQYVELFAAVMEPAA